MSDFLNKDGNEQSENGVENKSDFLKKNGKLISVGAVVIALGVVVGVTMLNGNKGKENKEEPAKVQQEEVEKTPEGEEEKTDEYTVDVQPEVKELVSTYYNAYAAGDIEQLQSVTQNLSDMEKSYIKMMNEYVESYSEITCYSKEGLDEGSNMVSVTFNMNFHNVEGGLPGMDFFYIRTGEDGRRYIDSRYCSFNRQMEEQETESEIDALISEFESGADVQKLRTEFQGKYDAAIEADENLKTMAGTVSEAIKGWKDSYNPGENQTEVATEENNEQPEGETPAEADGTDQENAPAESQPEETPEAPQEDTQEPEAPQEDSTPEINYVPEGTVLTANNSYNVRVSMNESAELVGTTAIGDSIKVILSYAEGWTKVEWNEKTGYIRTDLLLNN